MTHLLILISLIHLLFSFNIAQTFVVSGPFFTLIKFGELNQVHMNIGSLLAPLWPSLLQPAGLGSTMLRGVPLGIYKGSEALIIMSGVYLVSRKDDLID